MQPSQDAPLKVAILGGGGIGGFDTHAGQALNHGALLRELAECVTAFVEDLQADKLLDRVLVMDALVRQTAETAAGTR
jgi:uncharacterized protein (DUF1501 family)